MDEGGEAGCGVVNHRANRAGGATEGVYGGVGDGFMYFREEVEEAETRTKYDEGGEGFIIKACLPFQVFKEYFNIEDEGFENGVG